MAPTGRRRGTSLNVHAFEDLTLLPPREVVLDTSFVVNALLPLQRLHAPCQGFLERLSEADGTVFFNRLLELELAEVVFRIAVKEQHGGRAWPAKRFDGRVRRRASRLMREAFEAWDAVLEAVNWGRIELDEVANEVPALMAAFGLSSNDAVHAATADFTAAGVIVSTDSDFGALPAQRLQVLTTRTILGACRRRRPR